MTTPRAGEGRRTKMEKYVYGAIIRPDEDGGFWAEIPDLPGCYGQGETFSETIDSIIDGLETQLAYMAEDGLDIPPMSKITAEDGEVVYVYANPATVEIAGPVMSAAEAARVLGVTPGRVSQLIRAGKLRAHRKGTTTFVEVASVEDYAGSPRRAGRPSREYIEA